MSPILKTICQWRNKSITRGQLSRLSDRMLRDIGVLRFGIERGR